jgi:hypothetical protein
MLRSVWKKIAKKGGGGNVDHDPHVPVLLRSQFSLRCQALQFWKFLNGFAHTRFIFNAAVVWGGQVVETKIYFRFRHSTRPPSCRGKIRAAHFPANV